MSLIRLSCLFVSCLLLLACQHTETKPPIDRESTQLRAVLMKQNGQWIATDCISNTHERLQLLDDANFTADADTLVNRSSKGQLFIDVMGVITKQPSAGESGRFTVKKLNRLTTDVNKGCREDDYNRVVIRAIGKNPLWVTSIAPKGLVLERINQAPLVLPYVDERLPDGQMNFATEANNQKIQLWAAPERCVDEETGDIYSLRTILTINYQTLQGCGYLGKASGLIN